MSCAIPLIESTAKSFSSYPRKHILGAECHCSGIGSLRSCTSSLVLFPWLIALSDSDNMPTFLRGFQLHNHPQRLFNLCFRLVASRLHSAISFSYELLSPLSDMQKCQQSDRDIDNNFHEFLSSSCYLVYSALRRDILNTVYWFSCVSSLVLIPRSGTPSKSDKRTQNQRHCPLSLSGFPNVPSFGIYRFMILSADRLINYGFKVPQCGDDTATFSFLISPGVQ